MQPNFDITKLVERVQFIDMFNELTINSPTRMIAHVDAQDRMKIYAFERVVSICSDEELLEMLAPWRIIGSEAKILPFIRSLKNCVHVRHPEWYK